MELKEIGSEHTAEPWEVSQYGVLRNASTTEIIGTCCGDLKAINSRRIVACVNACKGLSNELLEGDDYTIKAELDTLDNQIAVRFKAENERDAISKLNPEVLCPACKGKEISSIYRNEDGGPAVCEVCQSKKLVRLTVAQEYTIKQIEAETRELREKLTASIALLKKIHEAIKKSEEDNIYFGR